MDNETKNTLKPIVIGVGIIIAVIVIIAAMPFTIIGAGDRGVVMQFGKVQPVVLDEGFHFIVPFITTVKHISVRVQKNDIKADAASKDLQTVTTDVVVNWHIQPAKTNLIYQRVGDLQDIVDRIISPAVNEVVKASTAQKNAEEIISQRPALKADIDEKLAKRLTPYDVILDDISITNIAFSDEFNKAIEAKQVAQQEAQQAVFNAQKAENDATATVNAAKGQAAAQQLLQQALTPELLQKMALDKWNGVLPIYIGGGSPIPFLNIK